MIITHRRRFNKEKINSVFKYIGVLSTQKTTPARRVVLSEMLIGEAVKIGINFPSLMPHSDIVNGRVILF